MTEKLLLALVVGFCALFPGPLFFFLRLSFFLPPIGLLLFHLVLISASYTSTPLPLHLAPSSWLSPSSCSTVFPHCFFHESLIFILHLSPYLLPGPGCLSSLICPFSSSLSLCLPAVSLYFFLFSVPLPSSCPSYPSCPYFLL
ncbi:hypothetical protein XELAEV_18044611mg [Xenopus laevis]|uniref:Uncharacterized protein n=1 Tax=Xenopus laevis TaxID=8355 RepID=A0A974H3V7_XENLA|nr:hypothetical protein XELAEV_18044611mg [Xenopus laevis]